MDEVSIRKAIPQDVASIAELSGVLGYPSSAEQVQTRLAAMANSPEHCVFVAQAKDGSVVGWIHVFTTLRVESEPIAELGGFVVAEASRGKGIGQLLLTHAESWAKNRGHTKLRVRSRTSRESARLFYERFGFSQTKTQRVFDKPLE